MKLKDIIDRQILKDRGRLYNLISNFYYEIQDDVHTLSSNPEKEIIGKAFEIKELRDLYLKHIKNCLRNDLFCDIAADILIQDGNCIIDKYSFGTLLQEALNKADEDKCIYYNTINYEKDENDLDVSPERLRDYRIYAACVREAYINDIELTKQNKCDSNISAQEKSVLNCLAENLGLSNNEIRGLFMSQIYSETEHPFINTDDMIKKLVNEGIVISTKNTIYTPEEIINMIREARGISIERKYLRRIISNMDDKMLNMVRRRHNIRSASSRDEKINLIVENDINPKEIFCYDIYPENTSENEKKKIFNEFVSSRLGISIENIQGRTLETKINSLIAYYDNDINETADTISKDGYEQLINILRKCEKLEKATETLNFSADTTITANLLIDYDIFAKDLLYRLTDDDLREICEQQSIKYFKNMNTMMLVSKIISNVNSMENLLIENYLALAANDSVTLAQKGITTLSNLGNIFQNTTQNIFEKLEIKIADYENPKRKKEHPDIILDFEDEGIVIVECKSGKEQYTKFAAVSRQMESYYNAYRQQYKVFGMILVANSFSDDFIAEAKNTNLNLALMDAQTLLEIYDGLKGKKYKLFPLALTKDLLVDSKSVIKRALNAK